MASRVVRTSYFFFQVYGDHPDLHSFPTRRSSDLAMQAAMQDMVGVCFTAAGLHVVPTFASKPLLGTNPIARSEEHTSELQSLRHLVCRLLLEKKKIRTKHSMYVLIITIHHAYTTP